MIEIKNLIKKYDDEVIFNYLDITFKDGLTIILGKSGSGKTTLLNLISNLDSLYQGQIIIDGIDIKDVEDKELFRYQTFSFIYQDYLLFNDLTIFANLSFYESSPFKIKEVLSFCNLNLPLKRKVSSLSGGEKQRLAIARAILSQGKIILGDEISGSLDRDNSHKIFALLKKLSLEKNGQELLVRGSLDKAGILGKTMRWTRVPDSEKSKYKPLKRSELRRFN